MIRSLMFTTVCILGLSASAMAQQMDMAAMEKWLPAKHATWHIVGRYEDDTAISSDGQGLAQVIDVIEMDVTLAWQDGNTIVGTPSIKNAPTVVTNLHDHEPACLAPVLKGPFDYATLDAVTPGLAGALHFTMTRTFPDVTVSQVCSGTKLAPAAKEADEEELMIPQPTFLAMGMSSEDMTVSPDKKSVIIKNPPGFNGWVFTLTPTPR